MPAGAFFRFQLINSIDQVTEASPIAIAYRLSENGDRPLAGYAAKIRGCDSPASTHSSVSELVYKALILFRELYPSDTRLHTRTRSDYVKNALHRNLTTPIIDLRRDKGSKLRERPH